MTININSKIIASIITISIVTILFFTGSAEAIKLKIDIPQKNILKGSMLNIMPSIEIESFELGQIDYIILKLHGPNNNDILCKFFPNGTMNSSDYGCKDIKIEKIILSQNSSIFGYGYGYRYSDSLGYGYGYGYMPGFLKYNITIDTDNLKFGNYSTELLVIIGDKTFNFNGDIITISKKPPITIPNNRCSIRAFDGSFNVDNKDFSNNRLKFYISPRDKNTITGSGSLSGQKDRDRFSYRFKIINVIENNKTNLVLNVSGTYRIGRDGIEKNIPETAVLNFDRINNKTSVYGEKIKIKSMAINFIEGCDSIINSLKQ